MQQLDLFGGTQCEFAKRKRQRTYRRRICPTSVQLCFDLKIISDDDEQEDRLVTDPIIHRILSAVEAEPIKTSAPRSIFDTSNGFLQIKMPQQGKRALTKIEIIEGVTRSTRILPQETLEWKEKEAQRRARQIVPRPPRSAKTLGRKLKEWVS